MPKRSHQKPTAWLARLGALALLAGLTLIVLAWPAGGDSTVTVTQGDFTLTCNSSVAEGETLACTLTNTSDTAAAWPVVALVHLSDDTDRALVVGSPIDAAFAARQPAAELDSGVEWIGDTLVGYSRFDWTGDAPGAPTTAPTSTSSPPDNARTVNIAISDDALQEGSERFYVALGPDGSRGVGLLSINKGAVTITEDDAKSSNASLTSLSVTAGGTRQTLTATSTSAQTVNVGYQVTEAALTAETAHQRAAMTIAATYDSSSVVLAAGGVTSLAVESGEQSASVPLGVGTTTVTLTVTAEDGTVATHPINIVRSAIGSATTVSVTVDDFVLTCPAEAEEGAVVECTLTNTGATPQPWPVVAVLHNAVDETRALVSEDSVIADVDPAFSKDLTLSEQTPERDGFNHGYGELFSGGSRSVHRIWGYEKFDWDGSAPAGDERTVVIELHDDSATADNDGETEVFYVALAPSDYTGLSQLTENTAPILLLQRSGANVIREVSFSAVTDTSAVAEVRIANTDGSTMYWRYRRSGQEWPTTQQRQNAGNLERLSLTGLTTGFRYELQVSFSSTFAGAATHTLDVGSIDSDPSLSALSLGDVTPSPSFASGTTSYTASVQFETDTVTVTATTTESSATAVITPDDADGTTAGHQVNVGTGQTDITVKVTAQSGDERTYTVTITRAAADLPLSVSFGDGAASLLEAVDRVWTVGARVDRSEAGEPDGGLDRLPEADAELPSSTSKFELTYSAAGLPAGLTMGNDRVIRGTPVAATDGEVTVTFTATGRAVDVDGKQIGETSTASLQFQATVMPPVVFDPASLSFFTNDVLEYTVGQAAPLNVRFPRATGGEGPLKYWLDNWEPRAPISTYATGLSFDPAVRALTSGTGNEEPEAGQSYALVYWAEDRNGARAVAYGSIAVSAPPTLPDIADKTVTVGQPVSIELPEATGGSKRIVWLRYQMEPQIPGLGFNSRTRTLSGTPTLTGQAQVTYTVTDRNGVSDSATFTVEVAPGASAPAAPQISARALPAPGLAALDWDDVDGATGYVVQLEPADADYPSFAADSVPDQTTLHVLPVRVQNDDGTMTRAVVFGLSDGAYKVRVAAVNAHGAGPWSPEANVTLPPEQDESSDEPEFYGGSDDGPDAAEGSQQPQLAGEVPGPVAALELTATADSVTVSWQPPEAGDPPERYIVHLRPEGGRTGSGKTKNPKAKKTTVTYDNLKPGVTYNVWVRAQNNAGKGERVSATITLPATPLPQ